MEQPKTLNAGSLDSLVSRVRQEWNDHPTVTNADRNTKQLLYMCACTITEMRDALMTWDKFATEYSPLVGRALADHVNIAFRKCRDEGRRALD